MRNIENDICPHCGKNVHYAGQPMHLAAGSVLNGHHPYVLGAALGQGGFGITYIALDLETHQRMAIKEYFPTHCSGRTGNVTVTAYSNQEEVYLKGKERFLDEARTLKSMSDLNSIVNVLDFFEANNSAYLVMEFLDGSSLKEYAAAHGTFPAQEFLQQINPLMEDIHRMHERGVIHRDIAPDNIILLPDGRMKLIDFGAARSCVGDKSMTVVVKKGFAPVEQYASRGTSPCTDVYAFAATIYYCITGKVPPDSAERLYNNVPLESPIALGADITQEQETALFKALELQQKARTQSMREFRESLEDTDPALEQETAPEKHPKEEAAVIKTVERRAVKKNFPALLVASAVILALCAGFFLFFGNGTELPASMETIPQLTTEPETVPLETTEESIPIPVYLPAENPTYAEDAWSANLLHKDFSAFEEERSSPVIYGSAIPRSSILSVTFLDTLGNAPDTSWDISAAQDRSVLAWVVQKGTDYDLYLAGEGGINAGESTAGLFSNYEKLNTIQNFDFFHMDNVLNARKMFWNCDALTEFDFSHSNLSNIDDMSSMFEDCSNLTNVIFSDQDLSKVTKMDNMFSGCINLFWCSFSNTTFSNVTYADDVFSGCSSLITVRYGMDDPYHPNDFVRMLKDSDYIAYSMPTYAGCSWVPASIVASGSNVEVSAENLEICVTDKREVTVTISNLALEEFYITDFNGKSNYYLYSWCFYMYGKDSYEVNTRTDSRRKYNNGRATLDQMDNLLYLVKAAGPNSRILNDVHTNIKLTYTADSITWTFKIPKKYSFDLTEMTHFELRVDGAAPRLYSVFP